MASIHSIPHGVRNGRSPHRMWIRIRPPNRFISLGAQLHLVSATFTQA